MFSGLGLNYKRSLLASNLNWGYIRPPHITTEATTTCDLSSCVGCRVKGELVGIVLPPLELLCSTLGCGPFFLTSLGGHASQGTKFLHHTIPGHLTGLIHLELSAS